MTYPGMLAVGVQPRRASNEGTNIPAVRAGKMGWMTIGEKLTKRMYFRITDEAWRNGASQNVELVIEYFDAAPGYIDLQYDSMDPNASSGGFKGVPVVWMRGSGTWKTKVLTIKDARFGGRCNGNDFRLQIKPQNDFNVRSIGIQKAK